MMNNWWFMWMLFVFIVFVPSLGLWLGLPQMGATLPEVYPATPGATVRGLRLSRYLRSSGVGMGW